MKRNKLTKEDVTESLLQKRLRGFRSAPRYVAENLYVFGWESDMLIKTKSGYWYEFECKISFSDFQHDFSKFEKHNFLRTGEYWHYQCVCRTQDEAQMALYDHSCNHIVKDGKWWLVHGKHRLDKTAKRPNYFAYIVPWYLQEKVEPLIPEYAGFVVMDEYGHLVTVKAPPLLHKDKYTDEQLNLCEKFYYNWHNRIQYIEQNSQHERIKSLCGYIDFLKAEYKAATGYDIKEVF